MNIRLLVLAALMVIVRLSSAEVEDGMSKYRLGAGDTISIIVFDEKELSMEKVRLSDAGTISYPMLGEIKVLGLTVSDLQNKVTEELKDKFLINPKVTVTINQYRDVFVIGQVHKPGNYPYQHGLTMRKAISIAGGFKDRAYKEAVSIIHENQDKATPIKSTLNTLVEPGDVIIVDESFF